eukprot:15042005-Alexandrium_andersonii.AAC.1
MGGGAPLATGRGRGGTHPIDWSPCRGVGRALSPQAIARFRWRSIFRPEAPVPVLSPLGAGVRGLSALGAVPGGLGPSGAARVHAPSARS